jgi:hypothetical protein
MYIDGKRITVDMCSVRRCGVDRRQRDVVACVNILTQSVQMLTFGFGPAGKSEAQRLCQTIHSGSKNFGFQFSVVEEDSRTCTNAEILAFEQ